MTNVDKKDFETLNSIAIKYYALVCEIATALSVREEEKEELIQVGMIAVMEYLYQHKRVARKLDYIKRIVCLAIRNYQSGDIMIDHAKGIDKKLNMLKRNIRQNPLVKHIAKALSSSEMEQFIKREDNAPEELGESMEDKILREETIDEVFNYLSSLDEQTRYIFCSSFGGYGYSYKTLDELKKKFNLTGHEIEKIKRSIIFELREYLNLEDKVGLKK